MLFEDYTYFNHQFPEPQYLGAKHTHLPWIKKFIPEKVKTAIDAFAGSQSVGFLFKQIGYKTITNDFLNFNNQIGLALIENKNTQLSNEDLKILFQPAENKSDFELMENTFTNLFFTKEELLLVYI
jgi:adenine-specific DNA methylase